MVLRLARVASIACCQGAVHSDAQAAEVCADAPGKTKGDSVHLMQSLTVQVEQVVDDGQADSDSPQGSASKLQEHGAAADNAARFFLQQLRKKVPDLALINMAVSNLHSAGERASDPTFLAFFLAALLATFCCCVATKLKDFSDQRYPVVDGTYEENLRESSVQRPGPRWNPSAWPTFRDSHSPKPVALSPQEMAHSSLLPVLPATSATLPAPATPPQSQTYLGAHSSQRPAQHSGTSNGHPGTSNVHLPTQTSSQPQTYSLPLSPLPKLRPVPRLASLEWKPEQASRTSMKLKRCPSPLCPSLVLPSRMSGFTIPMSEILDASESSGVLNISSALSHTALLQASVCANGANRRLEIKTTEPGAPVRASIGNSRTQRPGPNSINMFDIYGQGGSYYGLLDIRISGSCIITRHGQPVMTIDGDPEELNLWITSAGGEDVATAKCTNEGLGELESVEHVDIRVQPGMDAVLALACILAVLLFCPQ